MLTAWPVEDEQSSVRLVTMEREPWAAQDRFQVTKECLGWQEVQGLTWQALETLVALAWGPAGFLSHIGVPFRWEEVPLIAKWGGWVPPKDRTPGKITFMGGLRPLIDLLATQAVLSRSASEHQGLPPNLTAFLQGGSPPHEF
jgi:hypothetical protein